MAEYFMVFISHYIIIFDIFRATLLSNYTIYQMVTAEESIKTKSDGEEPKKTTTDDGSSSDDEVPELEEGEVTEEQKKVAEAAGIAEQVLILIQLSISK